ncbi:MAG: ABC transporter permease [Bacteroidales bacterium]|nr:ABC transporter permease [Bacteroidales bacterium]MCF8405259.1 ABC transporter permease [Bacteroidales bacterium]
MKLISVIKKSLREQIRSFWILFLTISMAPFFIAVYFLILESYQPQYDILVLNNDKGYVGSMVPINHGQLLFETASFILRDSSDLPFNIELADSREMAIGKLKNRKADALVVIPVDFSEKLQNKDDHFDKDPIGVEFIGDLTQIEYMVSAVWANEAIDQYVAHMQQRTSQIKVIETSLGYSGSVSDFDLMVPGLLILALVMLMFSATIAIISEVENKTIIRLKLSKISTLEFLSGVSIVQVLVGLVAILLSLATAMLMGFKPVGSMGTFLLITLLTSISIIAFSLILAAFTKTVNEVLIVGNFPLFLFMFFTGAAFPLEGKALFHIAGYPISFQGLMSPTHAISALKKIMIMGMGIIDILPEIISIVILIFIYFGIGVYAFRIKHMKVE